MDPSKPIIYVVDDEPLLCEMVEAILQIDGHQVLTFTDPRAALDAARKTQLPPTVLLTDYSMEPMDGLELIAGMKRLLPRLKTILFSGRVQSDVIQGATEKPDLFLSKPFIAKDFLLAIRNTVQLARA